MITSAKDWTPTVRYVRFFTKSSKIAFSISSGEQSHGSVNGNHAERWGTVCDDAVIVFAQSVGVTAQYCFTAHHADE